MPLKSNVLLLAVVVCVLTPIASVRADPVGPSVLDERITKLVTILLQSEHLSKHPLDDEISQRCMKTFLKMLDPMKVYFYQSDVDRFLSRRNSLDDMAKEGNITFAYEVFETFLQRLDERVALAGELLDAEYDFTVDEEILKDRDLVKYPTNPAEAQERWRKRIKYELLSLKADDEIDEEGRVAKVRRRYRSLDKRMHQTDGEELLEMYLTALTMSFDPHTSYMSPASHTNFLIQMRLELEGIGAALHSEDGYTVVHKIIPGGAADKDARLKPQDRIVGVGQGREGEIENVVDMKLSEVVKRIRGKAGDIVRLEIHSEDGRDRRIIDITRAKIELTDSEAKSRIFTEGTKPDGSPRKIGVIDLPSFYMDMEGARRNLPNYKSTTQDVRKILRQFEQEGVDGVILDLRRNSGGSLQESINLTGLFIEDGPIVQVKNSADQVVPYYDRDPGIVWGGPLIVLTSKFSASASEILAGAIQDYDRGLIVGDLATHGKGTVQSLTNLGQRLLGFSRNASRMGALKITMQQFYRPSGASTQNRGVLADVVLPSLTTHYAIGEADLDYSVAFDEVEGVPFKNYGMVDDAIRERLGEMSKQRRATSEDFQKVLHDVGIYLEQKERKYVTLNEEKFLAELEKLDAEKEEREALEEIADGADAEIERNKYLNETIAIMVDYLQLFAVPATDAAKVTSQAATLRN